MQQQPNVQVAASGRQPAATSIKRTNYLHPVPNSNRNSIDNNSMSNKKPEEEEDDDELQRISCDLNARIRLLQSKLHPAAATTGATGNRQLSNEGKAPIASSRRPQSRQSEDSAASPGSSSSELDSFSRCASPMAGNLISGHHQRAGNNRQSGVYQQQEEDSLSLNSSDSDTSNGSSSLAPTPPPRFSSLQSDSRGPEVAPFRPESSGQQQKQIRTSPFVNGLTGDATRRSQEAPTVDHRRPPPSGGQQVRTQFPYCAGQRQASNANRSLDHPSASAASRSQQQVDLSAGDSSRREPQLGLPLVHAQTSIAVASSLLMATATSRHQAKTNGKQQEFSCSALMNQTEKSSTSGDNNNSNSNKCSPLVSHAIPSIVQQKKQQQAASCFNNNSSVAANWQQVDPCGAQRTQQTSGQLQPQRQMLPQASSYPNQQQAQRDNLSPQSNGQQMHVAQHPPQQQQNHANQLMGTSLSNLNASHKSIQNMNQNGGNSNNNNSTSINCLQRQNQICNNNNYSPQQPTAGYLQQQMGAINLQQAPSLANSFSGQGVGQPMTNGQVKQPSCSERLALSQPPPVPCRPFAGLPSGPITKAVKDQLARQQMQQQRATAFTVVSNRPSSRQPISSVQRPPKRAPLEWQPPPPPQQTVSHAPRLANSRQHPALRPALSISSSASMSSLSSAASSQSAGSCSGSGCLSERHLHLPPASGRQPTNGLPVREPNTTISAASLMVRGQQQVISSSNNNNNSIKSYNKYPSSSQLDAIQKQHARDSQRQQQREQQQQQQDGGHQSSWSIDLDSSGALSTLEPTSRRRFRRRVRHSPTGSGQEPQQPLRSVVVVDGNGGSSVMAAAAGSATLPLNGAADCSGAGSQDEEEEEGDELFCSSGNQDHAPSLFGPFDESGAGDASGCSLCAECRRSVLPVLGPGGEWRGWPSELLAKQVGATYLDNEELNEEEDEQVFSSWPLVELHENPLNFVVSGHQQVDESPEVASQLQEEDNELRLARSQLLSLAESQQDKRAAIRMISSDSVQLLVTASSSNNNQQPAEETNAGEVAEELKVEKRRDEEEQTKRKSASLVMQPEGEAEAEKKSKQQVESSGESVDNRQLEANGTSPAAQVIPMQSASSVTTTAIITTTEEREAEQRASAAQAAARQRQAELLLRLKQQQAAGAQLEPRELPTLQQLQRQIREQKAAAAAESAANSTQLLSSERSHQQQRVQQWTAAAAAMVQQQRQQQQLVGQRSPSNEQATGLTSATTCDGNATASNNQMDSQALNLDYLQQANKLTNSNNNKNSIVNNHSTNTNYNNIIIEQQQQQKQQQISEPKQQETTKLRRQQNDDADCEISGSQQTRQMDGVGEGEEVKNGPLVVVSGRRDTNSYSQREKNNKPVASSLLKTADNFNSNNHNNRLDPTPSPRVSNNNNNHRIIRSNANTTDTNRLITSIEDQLSIQTTTNSFVVGGRSQQVAATTSSSLSPATTTTTTANNNHMLHSMNPRIRDLTCSLSLLAGQSSISASNSPTPSQASSLNSAAPNSILSDSTTLITEAAMNSSELIPKLIERLDRKLIVMKEEQLSLMREIELNESSGQRLFDQMRNQLTANELEKVSLHANEIEKVTKLILSLKMRLKRVESELKDRASSSQKRSQVQATADMNHHSSSSPICSPLDAEQQANNQTSQSSSQLVMRAAQQKGTGCLPSIAIRGISDPTSTVGLPKRNHQHHASLQLANTELTSGNKMMGDDGANKSLGGDLLRRRKQQHELSLLTNSSCDTSRSSPVSSPRSTGSQQHVVSSSQQAAVNQRQPASVLEEDSGTDSSSATQDRLRNHYHHQAAGSKTASTSSDSIFNSADSAIGSTITGHGGSSCHIEHQDQQHATISQSSLASSSSCSMVSSSSASVPNSPPLVSPAATTATGSNSSNNNHLLQSGSEKLQTSPANRNNSISDNNNSINSSITTTTAQSHDSGISSNNESSSTSMLHLLTDVDILVAKKTKLISQLEEAHQLEECIAHRNEIIVQRILKKYYDEQEQNGEIAEFKQFTRLKSLLLKDTHDIADRIDNAELQLTELRQTNQCSA